MPPFPAGPEFGFLSARVFRLPKPFRRDPSTSDEGLEFGPDDARAKLFTPGKRRKAAIAARDYVLAADGSGEALNTMSHEFRMLH